MNRKRRNEYSICRQLLMAVIGGCTLLVPCTHGFSGPITLGAGNFITLGAGNFIPNQQLLSSSSSKVLEHFKRNTPEMRMSSVIARGTSSRPSSKERDMLLVWDRTEDLVTLKRQQAYTTDTDRDKTPASHYKNNNNIKNNNNNNNRSNLLASSSILYNKDIPKTLGKKTTNTALTADKERLPKRENIKTKRGRPKGSTNKPKPPTLAKLEPLQQPLTKPQQQIPDSPKANSNTDKIDKILLSTTSQVKPHQYHALKRKGSKSSTMPGMERRQNLVKSTTRQIKQRQLSLYTNLGNVPDSLLDFVNKAHKIQRLTPTEEYDLGTQVQLSMRLHKVADKLSHHLGREPTEQEWVNSIPNLVSTVDDLHDKIAQGSNAKDRLVTANLRMVQRVVNLYIRNGLGTEYNAADMMSEGTMVSVYYNSNS